MITGKLGLALFTLAAGVASAQAQVHTSSALAGAALVAADRSGGAVGAVGAATQVGPKRAGQASSNAGGDVASFSPFEAAALVGSQRGRPTVVILYGTGCPRSPRDVSGFAALAERHAARDVSFLAFASDRVAEDVPGFLAQYGGAPFAPAHIKRWGPGQMAAAMATIGLQLPQPWNMPHVAVIDASGQVVGEWDAATDLRAIDATLRSLP